MDHILNIEEQEFVFIGEQSKLEGSFSFCGNTKVAGKLNGEVLMQNESPLYVEPHGHINGTIHCHDLIIYGKVEGQVKATGTLTVHPFAELTGDIEANNLNFMANAIINTSAQTTTTRS